MELSQYTLALVAGGFGIVGVLLGVLLTYRLALRLADKQFQHLQAVARLEARHVAAAELVSVFASDLDRIESREFTGELLDFLRQAYADHQREVLAKFQHHLEPAERARFRDDWDRYCFGDASAGARFGPEELDMPREECLFLHCCPIVSSPSAVDPYEHTAEKIRALLKYAGAG